MTESEFRDWARRAQGSFDERLKVLEKRVGEIELAPVRFRMPEHHRAFDGVLSRVKEEIAGGLVTGLGIATVRNDGVVGTVWLAEDFDQYALVGAVSQLGLAILDRAVADAAAGAASGETDEGRPETHEVEARRGSDLAASAPAGGV